MYRDSCGFERDECRLGFAYGFGEDLGLSFAYCSVGPDIRKFLEPLNNRASRPDGEGFQTVLVTATMSKVLEPSLAKGNRVMVFCNTLNSSRAVDHFLTENQFSTVNHHGEVPVEQSARGGQVVLADYPASINKKAENALYPLLELQNPTLFPIYQMPSPLVCLIRQQEALSPSTLLRLLLLPSHNLQSRQPFSHPTISYPPIHPNTLHPPCLSLAHFPMRPNSFLLPFNPPESSHLTTPDVPYARFLSSSSITGTYADSGPGCFNGLQKGVGPKSHQDTNFFCPETFAQFYLDQSSSHASGRLNISRETDAYNNSNGGNGNYNRQSSKCCKADPEEVEAYRASFGFSADDAISTSHYVEIVDVMEESFSMAPFSSNKRIEDENILSGLEKGVEKRDNFPKVQLKEVGRDEIMLWPVLEILVHSVLLQIKSNKNDLKMLQEVTCRVAML